MPLQYQLIMSHIVSQVRLWLGLQQTRLTFTITDVYIARVIAADKFDTSYYCISSVIVVPK